MASEYEGPNMTIYKNAKHFVNQYIVPSEECKKPEDIEVSSHELLGSAFSGMYIFIIQFYVSMTL